jgi:drug/metabolite transporter (DMT)-like permease
LVLLLAIVSATEGSLAVADRRTRSLAFLAGGFEVAGNVGYLLAIHRGSLAVAGVLVGLYPATTVLCARVVLREHLQRAQLIGLSVAALAVLLITVGATL